ncbi:MAG: hypothetical protein GY723_00940 [bacterium]|nr:hypothetical protein [bacterium]
MSIEVVQAASASFYVLTITVVGVRLLVLARRNRQLPELYLGLSLILGGTLGASLEAGAMVAVKDLDPERVGLMLAFGKFLGILALAMQGLFIWKVFRCDSRWAPGLLACYVGLACAAFAGFYLGGTFTTGQIPMGWFWLELLGRTAGSVWLICEASRYYGLMSRRVGLGLADPVVSNRFLLWAIAGGLGVLMMLTAAPPALYPGSTSLWMAYDLVVFSLCGVGFSIVYALAFFPLASYQRWLRGRVAPSA